MVGFDETSQQLLAEARSPSGPKPGWRERFDYEYKRKGTRNLFMLCEPLVGWRHGVVTEQHTMVDFAQQMRWSRDRRCRPYPQGFNIIRCYDAGTGADLQGLYTPLFIFG